MSMSSKSKRNRTRRNCNDSTEFAEDDTEDSEELQDQVNDLVRHFLSKGGEHVPFKKIDLKKTVLPNAGQDFKSILNSATKILKEVYGYNVIELNGTQKGLNEYIVSNSLPYIPDTTTATDSKEIPKDVNNILTLLVLSHIYMSNGSVSDSSLYNFLNLLGINIDNNHELFGNVKEFINVTLKQKKYIRLENDQKSQKIMFSWGSRAENEISKMEILNFVSKVYKKTSPQSWVEQYQAAKKQNLENESNQEK